MKLHNLFVPQFIHIENGTSYYMTVALYIPILPGINY